MEQIRYPLQANEMATATLDFLCNRPVMKFLILFMKGCCLLLLLGFALTIKGHSTKPMDYAAAATAVLWLIFNRQVHEYIIRQSMKGRRFASSNVEYKFDHKQIAYPTANGRSDSIDWSKLSLVFKNKDGFIIPLTGLRNAGQFIWLPHRALNSETQAKLLDIIQQAKLKVRNLGTAKS